MLWCLSANVTMTETSMGAMSKMSGCLAAAGVLLQHHRHAGVVAALAVGVAIAGWALSSLFLSTPGIPAGGLSGNVVELPYDRTLVEAGPQAGQRTQQALRALVGLATLVKAERIGEFRDA
jgi:hypothetical protein